MGLASTAYRRVEPARLEQRVAPRMSVVIKRTTVRGHGRQPVEAQLDDLSIYGCRLTVDAQFKANERLWLRFADGKPIAATAVWFEGDQLGCRFDEPLDRMLYRALTLSIN
jgi:hypothetical protein